MERWFTPQERGVILFLIGALVLGSVIYSYKLKNPVFTREYKIPEAKAKGKAELERLIQEIREPLKEPEITQPRPRQKIQRFPVNINTASKEKLTTLPGVGPMYAQRIIDYREKYGGFKSKEEIMEVKGIGEKRFEKLKDKITIK